MINPESLDLSKLPWLPLDAKSAFPKQSAIYFAIDSLGNIQYIGRSANVKQRWSNHHKFDELQAIGNVRIAYLFLDADLLPSVEAALIDWFDPHLNTIGKPQIGSIDSTCRIEIRLKNVRESRELSQYDLAKLAGMSPQNIQKLEQGRAKGIQLDTLDSLCRALKCEVNDLLVRVLN